MSYRDIQQQYDLAETEDLDDDELADIMIAQAVQTLDRALEDASLEGLRSTKQYIEEAIVLKGKSCFLDSKGELKDE